MIIIKVSDRIIKHCQQQIDKYNFGQRSEANGTKEQQLTGIIGQSVIMEAFNMPLINGADGFDDGIDILYKDNKIDVKTMGRTTDVKPNYVNNFLKVDHTLKRVVPELGQIKQPLKPLLTCMKYRTAF